MAPSIMAPRCRLVKGQLAPEQQQQQPRPAAVVARVQSLKNGNAVLHELQQLQKPGGMMRIRSSGRNGSSSSSSRRRFKLTVKAVEEVAGPASDSVVSEVAVLEEAPGTPGVTGPVGEKHRKPGVLDRGETLSGYAPAGKGDSGSSQSANGGAFSDARWVKGTWDLTAFTNNAKIDWDGVIDAEVKRRKWLEDNPETSSNEEPVVFDTSMIPWWAWVKRFHLPEAELLNGRAAMVGYFAAYLVDSLTGVGLVDQQSSFLGKLLIFVTVLGVLLIRKTEDVETLKTLAKESTFYDKQWQASWKEDKKPSE